VVDGLPVTTAARTVADLLAEREDESAVGRVVQDALRARQLSRPDVVAAATAAFRAYGASCADEFAGSLVGPAGPGR
jgi:hypothetical protein